jgi:hypothetical protein
MSGMHLLPVYYSTSNTRKRKQKKKPASVLEAERQHTKFLKKMGIKTNSRPVVQRLERTAHNGHVTGSNPVGSTNSIMYDSSMAKKPEKIYTGIEIIGIAQMHKSNAVPIRGKKQAIEIARMRRG